VASSAVRNSSPQLPAQLSPPPATFESADFNPGLRTKAPSPSSILRLRRTWPGPARLRWRSVRQGQRASLRRVVPLPRVIPGEPPALRWAPARDCTSWRGRSAAAADDQSQSRSSASAAIREAFSAWSRANLRTVTEPPKRTGLHQSQTHSDRETSTPRVGICSMRSALIKRAVCCLGVQRGRKPAGGPASCGSGV